MTPYSYRADPAVPEFPDDRPVMLFDGHCVMCSASARFLLRRDRQGLFRLAPAQSPLGQALYRHYGLEATDFETNLLLEGGVAYVKSESSIRVAVHLGWPWSLAQALRILPLGWRDALYELVARNRFRLFGRREVCFRPEPGQEARFLG